MPEHDDTEHHDGCLCGIEIRDHELTPDDELPEATGGVEATRKRRRKGTRTSVEGEA